MAYSCDVDYGSHVDIGTKLAALLNAATITTFHEAHVIKIGTDRFLAYIVYE